MKRKPVANKAEVLARLKENSARIRSYGIKRMSLFGSFVRDADIHKDSDVDFFIEWVPEKVTLRNVCGGCDFLEEILGRKIEMCQHNKLSPFILPQVLKEVEDVELDEVIAD